jgi:membrane-associated phospholipid phosphatase
MPQEGLRGKGRGTGFALRDDNHNNHDPVTRKIFLAFLFSASAAAAQTTDSASSTRPLFTARDALILGGFTAATIAVAPADRWITHHLQDPARQADQFWNRAATIGRLFGWPGSFVGVSGIYLVGLASGNEDVERMGLHAGESLVLATAVGTVMKRGFGRARPRVSPDNARNFTSKGWKDHGYRSFPSGHATAAFAIASAISLESGRHWPGSKWVIGPAMYGAATLTGLSRVYNNEHWASDVVAGAALGTMTGFKIYRYQYSHPGNWMDRRFIRAGLSLSNRGVVSPVLSIIPR